MKSILSLIGALTFSLAILAAPQTATAARGDCGQPLSDGLRPVAADCLYILAASVGSKTCAPACICDVTGGDGISGTDALACLLYAVGGPGPLNCSCGPTTTVGSTTSTTLEVASVSVSAAVTGDEVPDGVLTATASIDLTGNCAVQSILWSQLSGAAAQVNPADSASATVVLAGEGDYKAELFHHLSEPPITEEELPDNVQLPEGEFPGGLPSRFQVVGVNPFALEEAGVVSLEVEVTTSCGVATAEVDVDTALPWKASPGLRNVAVGTPVLLHGRDHVDVDADGFNDETGAATTYDWTLDSVPPGSTAALLLDAMAQNPELITDAPGIYRVTVTDTTRLPGTDVVTLEIYAGTWKGVITGQGGDGLPLAEDCDFCHDGSPARDLFTPWRATGHAEILTNNLNTSTHYGEGCFGCHTVGYDKDVANGGIDDAADYDDFLSAGLINNPDAGNWSAMLANYPAAARLANIQCENCHGPQSSSGVHMLGDPRVSLSADVCAACHGEPLRHARFQQWQLSGHANYELAIDEGSSGNCSRCHTANGFLTWLPVLLDDDPATDPTASISVSWSADEVHPQTCTACHDPHRIGNVSGSDTNATVRISGSTPPLIGGFQARGVGKGAICMPCHNSRRGRRNDATFDQFVGTSEAARAPHPSSQADVLLGQNAYLISVGVRGSHSFVKDTCVNCHMEQTLPPDVLSYKLGGTNHTFAASDTICSNCHGAAFNASGVEEAVDVTLADLQMLVEDAILLLIDDQINAGNVIDLNGEATIADAAQIAQLEFGESHGRQAITVTLADASILGPYRLSDVDVLDGISLACPDPLTRCELYDFADARLIKAGWNWVLISNDGSHGVHNPTFALAALDAGIDAVVGVILGNP